MTNITLEGYDELLAKLTRLEQMKQLGKAVKAAATHVKGKIAQYPGKPGRRPNPGLYGKSAKAARMRAGFFARLKSGAIEVPYRRGISPGSQTLGKKWTIKSENSGLTAVVGNSVTYGRLVQSDKKQTAFHAATGWKTVEEVAENERETVVRFIADELERIVGG